MRTSKPAATSARSADGAARRLDADDLFGMAELTGDAPLSDIKSEPPPPAFDDLELDIDEPAPARPPTGPTPAKAVDVRSEPPPPPFDSPPADAAATSETGAAAEGALQNLLQDPFDAIGFSASKPALDLEKKEKPAAAARIDSAPISKPPAEPEMPGRFLLSSALTGVLGAALVIALAIAGASSDDAIAAWLGVRAPSDIVAARVVTGLYDTASGKPVFFIRGRVENHSGKLRGPVRVTAELHADGATGKAEAIAGAEPSPEDVYSLRNASDADKLTRTLEFSQVERKIPPGESLPFFAVIVDPPADLLRARLHMRLESMDSWNPPSAKARKAK